ncbi:putative MFS transporter [Aspergillus glaucus CBS 516.65]|uniref:Major facilitator superfamily (MFS) profile domain-containing protein n=1 Tax=Aspergillus glaucus CBS 516.65 TaxID=1160497 RepID=A0A1L9V895_ASPGL|nr:hypothetical protein ASPGLDRAFT_1503438 [Aspergillus glaucus CBS 516.65]OJJ80115.1 hypothetical protein ASPGLDRAFT_1503438 [Aspergillus glaucus CBS 516.65]
MDSNLSQARLGTLEKDLNMTGTDYNLATSILFVGYLLMQLPSNLLLTKIRPSLFLGIAMAIWGVISACQAATTSFTGIGGVSLGHRIAWFYAGSSLANAFGGLIGAGVLGNLDGVHGISGWRWLFIIEGCITNFPSQLYPGTTSWLDEEEQAYAQWRLIHDAGEADDTEAGNISEALRLVLTDPRIYLFTLLQHTSLLSQNFQYFFPTIVQTLGYGNIETLLITAPVWIATFLVSLVVTWTSGKTNDRSIHIILLMLVSVAGAIICTATTNLGARFFAMFFPIANMLGNTASIYGSYMWPSSSGLRYTPGGSATAGVALLVAVLAMVIRMVHAKMNRQLQEQEESNEHGETSQHPVGCRYIL